ncbi:uncharacterized protein LOC110735399 isoform X3 [Chenopodium quinoa]|uniref:uncharacterized protein LOC110735399 isoform X3 n=1 Tax=Chenopodium quinoa TaxID=63459 RepID=UPI000B7959BC|nr:uncharacterized protein LOC110735399 isoform X3 [Chenopodium quinoa]
MAALALPTLLNLDILLLHAFQVPHYSTGKVKVPEFLNGKGKGVEAHVGKLESEFGDLQKLLVVRTLKLKKLDFPCKHEIAHTDLPPTYSIRLGLANLECISRNLA